MQFWSAFLQKIFLPYFVEPLLSQGKPSLQSSTFSPNYPSEKAFDGNLNQDFGGGSCTLTNKEQRAWIYVDLLHSALITSVKIYNRRDEKSQRLNNAEIVVWDMSNFNDRTQCASFEYITTSNQIQTFYCEPNVIGRYVGLQNRELPLNICEMQGFGHYQ